LIGIQPGQATIAAADLKHALAGQAPGQIKQRGRLVSFRVEPDR
jgi:hypothetical protein